MAFCTTKTLRKKPIWHTQPGQSPLSLSIMFRSPLKTKLMAFAMALLLLAPSCSTTSRKPKLLVMITVDGLRGDLLNKYHQAFTGGFKRLLEQGMVFENAWVNHAITVSHAGHVTLATGNHPQHHGIVDAAFYQRKDQTLVFTDAFADSTYRLAGFEDLKSISAKNVSCTGLSEWIHENNADAQSLCLGTGNISSALYGFAPHTPVYWYYYPAMQYVTSTYYQDTYPQWITNFNKGRLRTLMKAARTWNNSVPQKWRSLANPDDDVHESQGRFNTFPHAFETELAEYASDTLMAPAYWLTATPFADLATIELAIKGIEAMQLGQGSTTDYLSIVLSHLDNTCHYYGVSSQETFDVLLRLDKALGNFFSQLDEKIGKDNYVVAFSSDHGFPEIPEQTLEKGQWAKRITDKEIEAVMDEVKQVVALEKNPTLRVNKVIALLKEKDFVADVYSPHQLNDTKKSNDPYLELYKRSHTPNRVPRLPFFSLQNAQSPIAELGIMVRLKDNAIIDLDVAIHGSPYDHDRFVPLIFMGAGIKPGHSSEKVCTADVAPTLANMARLKKPPTDGRVILQNRP